MHPSLRRPTPPAGPPAVPCPPTWSRPGDTGSDRGHEGPVRPQLHLEYCALGPQAAPALHRDSRQQQQQQQQEQQQSMGSAGSSPNPTQGCRLPLPPPARARTCASSVARRTLPVAAASAVAAASWRPLSRPSRRVATSPPPLWCCCAAELGPAEEPAALLASPRTARSTAGRARSRSQALSAASRRKAASLRVGRGGRSAVGAQNRRCCRSAGERLLE